MNMTVMNPQCHHPMGEGIHVLIPIGQLLISVIESMGIENEIAQIYDQLLQKATPGRKANVVALVTGRSPLGVAKTYLVLRLTKAHDKEIELPRAVALLAEEGYEQLALESAKLFAEEFKSYE